MVTSSPRTGAASRFSGRWVPLFPILALGLGGPTACSDDSPRPEPDVADATAADGNSTDDARDCVAAATSEAWRTTALSLQDHGCGAFVQGRRRLAADVEVTGALELQRIGPFLYAFWADGDKLRYRFAALGAKGDKSCTISPEPGQECLSWSLDWYELPTPNGALGVSAASVGGQVYLAFHDAQGQIHIRRLYMWINGQLLYYSPIWDIPITATTPATDHTPELVELHAGGAEGGLGVIYLARTGTYWRLRFDGTTWTGAQLRDPNNVPISGAYGPAALGWPDASVTGFSAAEHRTIAILPGTPYEDPSDPGYLAGDMRLYRLNFGSGRWENISPPYLGRTAGKPFMAYRHQRQTDGNARFDFPGHFMLGSMIHCWGGECPFVALYGPVSRTTPPGPGIGNPPARAFMQNGWAITHPGSSAALYADATIDNVFGLAPCSVPSWAVWGEYGVWFYPHADGAPDHDFIVRSDFRVIEDATCTVIGDLESRRFDCGEFDIND